MRRAFVMGSNGPADNDLSPLRYAHQDAERMKACFLGARCGFVVEMPTPGTDVFEVRRQLTSVAESCTPEDTFVCYFSGHGILEKGALFLLWENTQLDRLLGTAIPVSDIMQVLRYCKASSRLFILDCCHAGTVATMLGLKDAAGVPVQELEISPDNYFVLMASDRLERARELETLQGSFLTMNITAALEEKFTEADKDKDGRISMQDLHQWLEERAIIHNQLYPATRVSSPYLLGKQKGEFYLTLAASTWVPYELDWPDGSTMVVLPIHPIEKMKAWRQLGSEYSDLIRSTAALCISKYPIINAQYKRFVEDSGGKEPVGEHYISQPEEPTQNKVSEQKRGGSWQGPFYPWRTEEFRDPEKPVVCVSYYDAIAYCDWVNGLKTEYESHTMLPGPDLWDYAAFGTEFPSYNPDTLLARNQRIHHKASAPASIDRRGTRSNTLGVSDLLGNVWEWCVKKEDIGGVARVSMGEEVSGVIISHSFDLEGYVAPPAHKVALPDLEGLQIELRGGGFLDDLSRVKPTLPVYRLIDGVNTHHSDLGFRIAAVIPIEDLPEEVQRRLLPMRSNRR